MQAVMTSKGQVTIPVSVRSKLRLKTGDTLDFMVVGTDRIEIVPTRMSVRSLKGLVPKPARAVSLKDMDRAIGRGGE